MPLCLIFPPISLSPLFSAVPGAYLGIAGYRLPRQPHRETLCRCQGNLLLRLLTLSFLPERFNSREREQVWRKGERVLVSVEQGEGGGRSPKAEKGKKMVRFLVIIFDGASEDVPNEDLTLIKDDSLSFSISFSFSRSLSFPYQR